MTAFYCSCTHTEAAHVGYEAVLVRVGGDNVRGCSACLECQGVHTTETVFHVVLWTEGQTGIEFSLGLEGTIATREVAERCAAVYRECLQLGYETIGDPTQAFRSRVGILEMPAPDLRLGHPAPRDDVEQISIEVRHIFERKHKKGTPT